MRALVWFRRDLRVTDNMALYFAAEAADDGVVGLYLITPQQWREHDEADCKIAFWLRNVHALSAQLQERNIPLVVRHCETYAEVPEVVLDVAKECDCRRIYFNREYEVNESRRDDAVGEACGEADIAVESFDDHVVVPPGEVLTKDGRVYSVFTPFRKSWEKVAFDYLRVLPAPAKQAKLPIAASDPPTSIDGYNFSNDRQDLWPAGEGEAIERLAKFRDRAADYKQHRDLPAWNGTSQLSPYLAAGVISPRQCVADAVAWNDGTFAGDEGIQTWISELVWREFYAHVLVGFPRVSMHRAFRQDTEAVKWRHDEQDFQAWCDGNTGYPIVDAGMRQLNRTGWMHNRLRMVVAMFLSKHLLLDWRWGERYFMQRLVDGDLAANNGGWQWSASTGTDAAPYFRIFNPFSQSKRFDEDGRFIKKFCPELESVPAPALHDPDKLAAEREARSINYPAPIVDQKAGRQRALEAFKSVR